MTEADFILWLREHRPLLACAVEYCCTAEEMRATLNAATGLAILPTDEIEPSLERWLDAIRRYSK